ncbi:MAG: hypothetical protein LBR31_03430 [Desulfovibrio sp.]|jgi:CRISPR-associated endonuclease Csn1|nr:hypothetical protein [Desulfovibrio sp.]
MPKYYRYYLGIDLGIASIGTALVFVDNEGNLTKILDLGVRTFSVPEGAAIRRARRLERKHIRRRRQRLAKLKTELQQRGLLPADTGQLRCFMRKNPYCLRAHGASAAYDNLFDLGRCLLHMAKFRGAGFLTQSEENPDADLSEEPKKKKDSQKTANAYRLLEKNIKDSGKTLSSFFVERLEKKKPLRRRAHHVSTKAVDYAVPRFLVKDEFRKIWEKQSEHYKNLTPELEEKIYKLIFGDHPHAPYATGFCTLIPGQKRLPKMHRLAEQRRIYEQLANVRYVTAKGECPLSRDMRDELAQRAFGEGHNLSATAIRKCIAKTAGQTVVRVNLGEDAKPIRGFCQIQAFAHIPAWQAMPLEQRDDLVDFIANPAIHPEDENSELLAEDDVIAALCARLNLSGAEGEKTVGAALARLTPGRSNLGLEATQRILQKLIEGRQIEEINPHTGEVTAIWRPHTHRTAADACGFEAEEEALRKKRGTYAQLPYYGKVLRQDVTPIHPWHIRQAAAEEAAHGRIPNPVVHTALNQLRKVVNEIVQLYGKPQRIHIELARELGMSAVRRKELQSEMRKREKENADIDAELKKLGLFPSRTNRTKYRLWQEQGGRSLFSYAEIKQSDIAACEIEHLIPQSHGGSNSYMNLALVPGNENFAKGNAFPYEFIQKIAPNAWQHISKAIAEKSFPQAKKWRFSPDASSRFAEQGDEDATDSRLSNTSYMAKIAARYLSMLCSDVVAVKGGTTAQLRHLWGLDGIEYELFGLPIRKHKHDPHTEEILVNAFGYPERDPLWVAKPRIDHRHHAVDAFVAACTTRSMVSRLVRAEKNNQRVKDIPSPFGGDSGLLRRQLQEALRKVVVSPKKEHGKAGQLHDATKYRILQRDTRRNSGMTLIRYCKSIDTLKDKKSVAGILPGATIPQDLPAARRASDRCESIKTAIESRYVDAENNLEKKRDEARKNGGIVRELSEKEREKAIVAEAIALARREEAIGATYPIIKYKTLVAVNDGLQFGFEPKENYCVEFYEDPDGVVGWECITRIDANNHAFVPEWKDKGGRFIWRLCIDDVIEVELTPELKAELKDLCPEGKCFMVVQKMSDNKLQCNLLNDARPLDGRASTVKSGTVVIEEYTRWTSGGKGLITWCRLKARKVDISPFGKILHKHKKLWHGKKTT